MSGRIIALTAAAALTVLGCGGKANLAVSNDELYRKAKEQLQTGQYLKTRKTLGLVGLAEPIEAELDPLVKLATADAYFFQGGGLNVIEAQSRYQQFLNFYPTHPLAPYAQYQLGECLLLQSEKPANDQEFTKRAIEEYRKVPGLDPASAYARASRTRVGSARDKLAEKEWIVARFYAKRKKWPAVASRLQGLLEDHPSFEARDEVFLLLGEALLEGGSRTEARIYLEKIAGDHPDDALGKRARALLARADREPSS